MLPPLMKELKLPRCPHCQMALPHLNMQGENVTNNYSGAGAGTWRTYVCRSCGGVVLAVADRDGRQIRDYWPKTPSVQEAIPDRARSFLQQAIDSIHSADGSVMLSASAVDEMLKSKGYEDGSLFSRIQKAAEDHVITAEMAAWAHDIRLDANDPRHAEKNAPLKTKADAERSVEFTSALGEFLFVLPAKVMRGREAGSQAIPSESST